VIAIAYAAPFGVFRDFTAGYFRASFRFAPPSVLYGLILNLVGMEMRKELGPTATLTKDDLPVFELASAARPRDPRRHSLGAKSGTHLPGSGVLFQQLHALPVGSTNKHRIPLTKGNKHHISPGRREVLWGIRGVCLVRADSAFESKLQAALRETPWKLEDGGSRYGVPFLGDNSFMLEELQAIEPDHSEVEWLVQVQQREQSFDMGFGDEEDDFGESSTPFRLTLWADRAGMKTTRSAFFQTKPAPLNTPPSNAWVTVGPSQLVVK
jgi:CRISPR-associated protein Cas5t